MRTLCAYMPYIGGTAGHIHLLEHFPDMRTIADVVRELKTCSSRWISGLHSCDANNSGKSGYGYFSISASVYPRVAEYVCTQREHHTNGAGQMSPRVKAPDVCKGDWTTAIAVAPARGRAAERRRRVNAHGAGTKQIGRKTKKMVAISEKVFIFKQNTSLAALT